MVLVLSGALLLAAAPVCASDRCPMGAAQRATCRAMGLDCCQSRRGSLSHASPQAPALAPALAPGRAAEIATGDGAVTASPSLPDAMPAMVQGVGLFTLLAVFRI